MVPVLLLRSVEVFQGLTDEELNAIRPLCEEVSIEKEKALFEEHDPADHLYTLIQGNISLRYSLPSRPTGEENRVATITEGMTFGWSGLHPKKKYTLTAYCTEENCKALRIDSKRLGELLDENHTIGYKVMRNLAKLIGDRFIALQDKIAKVYGQDAIDGW